MIFELWGILLLKILRKWLFDRCFLLSVDTVFNGGEYALNFAKILNPTKSIDL